MRSRRSTRRRSWTRPTRRAFARASSSSRSSTAPRRRSAFEAVLAVNRDQPQALLGLAQARDFDGERGVPDLLDAALKVNPNFVEARAYKSGLLLALEDFPAARAEAEKALAENPSSAEALSALAAAQYVAGDLAAFAETRRRAEALFPRSGELLVTVAEAAVRNRLYREGARLAAEALVLDPQSWPALASLGQNQLRLGEIDAARQNLEKSFDGDPYNVWVKNTLDLLDTFVNYTTVGGRAFPPLPGKEGGRSPRAADGRARRGSDRETLGPVRLPARDPIRVEAYPSHADFSVRTVGLAGLGALGVSFGPVVAIDSPQARDRGTFNWGSTLWHELAHVVTLGASANRVPRWLTEGISVYEERRARPGWGDDLSIEFLLAYQANGLLPLRDLNNGFVRPNRPEQVSLSYYQASLVVEQIEARHGIAGLRDLLKAYAKGVTTETAFQAALGRSIDQVDEEFKSALKTSLTKPLAGIRGASSRTPQDRSALPEGETRARLEARVSKDDSDFIAQVGLGRLNHRENRDDEALKHLERAAQLWPESAGEESPYLPIAEIKGARGDRDGAIAALEAYVARNESSDAARSQLAALLEAKGRTNEALTVLDSSVFIYPFDPKLHERRALLAAQLQKSSTVREARRAIVELRPRRQGGSVLPACPGRTRCGRPPRSSAERPALARDRAAVRARAGTPAEDPPGREVAMTPPFEDPGPHPPHWSDPRLHRRRARPARRAVRERSLQRPFHVRPGQVPAVPMGTGALRVGPGPQVEPRLSARRRALSEDPPRNHLDRSEHGVGDRGLRRAHPLRLPYRLRLRARILDPEREGDREPSRLSEEGRFRDLRRLLRTGGTEPGGPNARGPARSALHRDSDGPSGVGLVLQDR